jgi:hypothetical protein
MTATTTISLASFNETPDFSVHNYNASAHVIIDVLGFYIVPIAATLRPDGTIYGGTNRAFYSGRQSVGSYTVTLDRDVTFCSPTVSVYETGHYAKVTTYSSHVVSISVWKLVNGAVAPVDDYVQMSVDC